MHIPADENSRRRGGGCESIVGIRSAERALKNRSPAKRRSDEKNDPKEFFGARASQAFREPVKTATPSNFPRL